MVTLGALFIVSLGVSAQTDIEVLSQRLEAMENEMQELRREIELSASREEVQAHERSIAAAGEWRQPDTLIHMAGYADVGYLDSQSDDGSFTVGSYSPIFHFQYRDIVMFESEIELEVGEDGETETKLEYLSVDWFLNDYMAIVCGRILNPIGQFRQNLHPSWINKN